MPAELEAVPELPLIKVSRRDRRALERMSGPKPPSSRVLALAVAALVFAVGFLVGRLGSIDADGPSVRALPAAEGLTISDVEGSAVYMLWTNEPLATVALQDLYSGDVVPRARLSPPFEPSDDAATSVAAYEGSIAVMLSDGESSFVAMAPDGKTTHAWVPGLEAAWTSPDELLVRESDDTVTAWSARSGSLRAREWGSAERLFQTPHGAFALSAGRLMSGDGEDVLEIPPGAEVLATDGDRALIDDGEVSLWDGTAPTTIDVDDYRAVAASFEPNGDRVAVVLGRGDSLTLGISDARGNVALKPIRASAGGCRPAVSWDAARRWLYVGAGDGELHAVETGGARISSVRTKAVGCGLAWIS